MDMRMQMLLKLLQHGIGYAIGLASILKSWCSRRSALKYLEIVIKKLIPALTRWIVSDDEIH